MSWVKTQVVTLTRDPAKVFECVLERALVHARAIAPDLELAVQLLKQQLPDESKDPNKFKQWWSANSQAWTEQLREVMIEHRNIGHNWQFGNQQCQALKHYYDATSLLVDCLNSDDFVTSLVREEIEKTLLLPSRHVVIDPL